MKSKEEILMKHFEAEYGFRVPDHRIPGFEYIFKAMEEFAKQEYNGFSEPEKELPEIENHFDNPMLTNHHHIPFHGGWITWRGKGEPSEKQMAAFEEMAKIVQALDARQLKDLQDG